MILQINAFISSSASLKRHMLINSLKYKQKRQSRGVGEILFIASKIDTPEGSSVIEIE
jgi:hypothetical protein